MAAEYEFSDRIETLAKDLIKQHHVHLSHAKIAYVMKLTPEEIGGTVKPQKPPRIGKHKAIGTARSLSTLQHLLSGYDFVIEVDEPRWDMLELEQQTALVDHELCHCARDEKGWYIKDHDVEEFVAVVERRGAWRHEIKSMVDAVQAFLPFDEASGAKSAESQVQ
jgi:hypothetical protein